MSDHTNPIFESITRDRAILYLEAAGLDHITASKHLKGYVHKGLVDVDELPEWLNTAVINGFDECEYMMIEAREEFGF